MAVGWTAVDLMVTRVGAVHHHSHVNVPVPSIQDGTQGCALMGIASLSGTCL